MPEPVGNLYTLSYSLDGEDTATQALDANTSAGRAALHAAMDTATAGGALVITITKL